MSIDAYLNRGAYAAPAERRGHAAAPAATTSTGRAASRSRRAISPAVRPVLVVAALVLLTAAAWALALPAGLAAAGLSCLVLEALVKGLADAPRSS